MAKARIVAQAKCEIPPWARRARVPIQLAAAFILGLTKTLAPSLQLRAVAAILVLLPGRLDNCTRLFSDLLK
jgi:hypothetical protein